MKTLNRRSIHRFSLPITVCLTLIASCTGKPIEQDLASGDATVEIKYLDSMTVDIIDDIRMKRREFYKDALTNKNWKKEYPQGTQGAIDREATIAAAINANAQRDQSVLERYSAEGSRQLSALENSEELGNEVLEHNKKIISQTNQLNDAKVQAVESQAETLAELNKAKVEAVKVLIEEIQIERKKIDERISSLQEEASNAKKELRNIKQDIEGWERKLDNDLNNTELQGKIERAKIIEGELKKTIENIEGTDGTPGAIGALYTQKNALITSITTLGTDSGKIDTSSLLAGLTKIPGQNQNDGIVLDHSRLEKYVDPVTKTTHKWENGAWVPQSKEEINITQHPQAPAPDTPAYLAYAVKQLDSINNAITKLTNANPDEAIRGTKDKVLAPPIERIRNDEAVLDYLLDGYRDTQIYSGAEYGGMVRRVLPFSFVFTPGSSTKSGFGARVVLRPDQEQIEEAVAMIAPHLNAVNRDRLKGYSQRYEAAEVKINEENEIERDILTRDLLYYDWNISECKMIPSNENTKSDEFSWNLFNAALEKSGFFHGNDRNIFWRAYSVSINALREALEDAKSGKVGQRKYGTNMYEYDLTSVAGELYSLLKEVNDIPTPEAPGSVYRLSLPDYSNNMHSSLSEICQIKKMIGVDINKNFRDEDNIKIHRFIDSVNDVIVNMTSAGLVYDLHLSSNPLFSAQKNDSAEVKKEKRTITITKEGSEYRAKLMEITQDSKNLKNAIAFSAQPRIIQNTSREHVVEIADTAKMNTLLAAAVTANEVTDKLGLNIGGEIAAALSSASAFIKRIPYAVPFTGQSFSIEKKDMFDPNENQTFGWKYYKTPSGATQMGGVAHSFKTTPLNSAVVVSMPEWMSRLNVEYQISHDGKNWERAGDEDILLSGASLRGVLSGSGFDSWVKYHIYREVDGSIGMPQLKSCYGEKEENNIIFGNSKGDTAICGENLHGVKGVLVAGRYIDEIEKVSSNLIKVKSFRLDPNECAGGKNLKCRVVLLSDFGAHEGADDYYLEFTSSEEQYEKIDLQGLVDPEATTANDKIKVVFKNTEVPVISYRLDNEERQAIIATDKKETREYSKNELLKICLRNKNQEQCTIPLYGQVTIGGKTIDGILHRIEMNKIGWWESYPKSDPSIYSKYVVESGSNYIFSIAAAQNKTFVLLDKILVNNKEHTFTFSNEESIDVSISKDDLKNFCKGNENSCNVSIKYTLENKWIPIGYIQLPTEE